MSATNLKISKVLVTISVT